MTIDKLDTQTRRDLPDNVAFSDNIFGPYQQKVFNHLYRITKSREKAEDLTQDVFLRAYQNIEGVQARGEFKAGPWLYRIATNLASDQLRRDRVVRFEPMDPLTPPPFSTSSKYDQPEQYAVMIEDQREVRTALANLPPRYKQALLDREVEGLSCEEIGERLGISRSAAKSILFRARQALRTEIERKPMPLVINIDGSIHIHQPEPRLEPEVKAIEVKAKLKTPDFLPKEMQQEESSPLLVKGFEKVRENSQSELLQLAETNLLLRTKETPHLEEVITSEAQVRAKAGEMYAVDFFIGQLNELRAAGIPMPDISVLIHPVKLIESKPAVIPLKVAETPKPEIILVEPKPTKSNLKVKNNQSPAFQDSAEVPDLSILLQAKQPSLRDPEVIALTERAQSGDKSAFEGIYTRYIGPIYRHLLRMVKDPEQAMDLAQEVFVKAQEKIGLTKEGTTIGPWLYRTAKNTAIDQIRGTSKKPTYYFIDGYDIEDKRNSSGAGSIDNTELSLDLTLVLDKLTADQRAVLECRYLQGMDTLQTAEAIAKTLSAVKKLQSRGLAACRKILVTQATV